MEAFPDEGDMKIPRALAAYRDVGYRYMLLPDHVPQIDGRDPSGVAFAYCYGYIQLLRLHPGADRRARAAAGWCEGAGVDSQPFPTDTFLYGEL
jgi:hypothetical protein